MSPVRQSALDAYWAADTPKKHADAYARMMALGFKPGYGERESIGQWLARQFRRLYWETK